MEEEFKPILCVVCHNVKTLENCTVVEESIRNALDAFRLELPAEETDKSMICYTCCTKVFEAFRFKATCTDTEDCILPYVNSKNGAPIDLKEIYLMERGKQQSRNVSENERICRLCTQIVTYGFTFVKDIEIDLIRICIPEVNFNFTEEPVVCTDCLQSLKMHSIFLRNCSGVQKFENDCEVTTEDKFCIKAEEIEIKPEANNVDTDTPSPEDELSDFQTKGEGILKTHLLEVPKYSCETCSFQTNIKNRLLSHQLRHREVFEATVYIRGTPESETKSKASPTRDQVARKDIPLVKMYNCDECPYETIYYVSLKLHQLKHKDPSEVPIYKCEKCSYQTRHKNGLRSHQLMHKDISEIEMYKCDSCDYEAKRKGELNRHQLTHKTISAMQMYTCDLCNFETKYRTSLTNHELKHKDSSEIRMYKCGTCNFETRYRKCLHEHIRKHKDISEVQTYKCGVCNFETKYKNSLVNHKLKHRDPSEVIMFKCDACKFQSKYKHSLVKHKLKHNVADVKLYTCDICRYETKVEGSLKLHKQHVHTNPSAVKTYKCDKCNYETRHKICFGSHQLVHSDVRMYVCHPCGYETKFKGDFLKHQRRSKHQ